METPTSSKQEYLEALHHLEREGVPVTNSELAEHLDVAPASVSQMLKALDAEGLVTYVPYKGATLTESGRHEANETVRRHRLWERFLTDILGMPWDQVHDEACRAEHVLSDEVARRLEDLLGHPETCPHGRPVPRADGVILAETACPLNEVVPPARTHVVSITDEEPQLLMYLEEIGLVPGAAVSVERKEPFDGPVMVRVARHVRAVGPKVAAKVMVAVEVGRPTPAKRHPGGQNPQRHDRRVS